MAALATTNLTMLDQIKALDPSGNLAPVAEILNITAEGFDEMVWREGNLTTGHQHNVRTGLPTPTWGRLYQGVLPTKGTLAQVVDHTGFLEDLSETDKRLVDMAPNPAAWRMQEDRPHVEGMSQEFWRTVFKGRLDESEKFVGLEPRFNSTVAANGDNVISNSLDESGDISSVWLIGWSDRTAFGIVPRNSKFGLQQEDHGTDWITDSNGGRFQVYRTYWRWDCGLAVPDWRYIVRAQVDLSELNDDAATGGVNLPFMFNDMIERLPSDAFSTTRVAFYANRSVISKARKQITNGVKGSTLALREVGAAGEMTAKRKFFFDDIPVNRVDVLSADETIVATS